MVQPRDRVTRVRSVAVLGFIASAAAGAGCHTPATVVVPPPPRAEPARAPGFGVDALFAASELRFDGKKVVTNYDADEGGETHASETETRWTVTCTQAPVAGSADRRVAEISCTSKPVPDAPGATSSESEPFPMPLDGYWIATSSAVWHVANADDALVPVERLMSLPPTARSDEQPDPEADPRDPPAREVYATRADGGGAWCHEHTSDPGGGAEASTWSICLDARGLVSGSSSDGHGAVVWETSFSRR